MKTQLLTLALCLQLFVACNKNDDDNSPTSSLCQDNLPAITTTGANTFGCCINGNLLIPRDGTGTVGGSDSGLSGWGDPTGNNQYIEIDVKDYKSTRTASILIHIQNPLQNGIGEYVINQSNGYRGLDGMNNTYIHCRVFDEKTNTYQYYRSTEGSGLINIYTVQFIPNSSDKISGTFNCIVKNSSNPNDIIEIKDGRFDINWITLPNKSFP